MQALLFCPYCGYDGINLKPRPSEDDSWTWDFKCPDCDTSGEITIDMHT